jgi:hypothetical protein
MGAFIAIASIFGLLYVKHHAAALAAGGSTAGAAGTLSITGAPDSSVSYDTKAPAQADPIGNTHLGTADPVYSTNGEIIALPLRPSDVEYGGGITGLVGVDHDPNPAGSTGSGISAIEKLNAPGARAPIAGGASGAGMPTPRLPLFPTFRRFAGGAPVAKAGDSGAGRVPVVTPGGGPASRHPVSPLTPTNQIAHAPVSSLVHMAHSAAPTVYGAGGARRKALL